MTGEAAMANAEVRIGAVVTAPYRLISDRAASLDVAVSPEELAELAVRLDMCEDEPAALEALFAYLADKHHDKVIETLLKPSRLPQKGPPRPSRVSLARLFSTLGTAVGILDQNGTGRKPNVQHGATQNRIGNLHQIRP